MRFFYLLLLLACSMFSANSAMWQSQHHSNRIILQGNVPHEMNDTLFVSLPELQYEDVPVVVADTSSDSLYLANESYDMSLTIASRSLKGSGDFTARFCYSEGCTEATRFQRVEEIQPLTFPQHPEPPLPYQVEDVTFTGASTGLTYGGTLVTPDRGTYPVAVLINGTGKQGRDYSYSGHQFFTVLADYLARQGIGSLRMDDRGEGETTGNFGTATTRDFANDIEEAVGYIKERTAIDTSYVGLIGHSEGGMVASIVTAEDDDVDFMVSLSGVATDGVRNLGTQNRAILKSMGRPDSLLNREMKLYNRLFQTVRDHASASDSVLKQHMRATIDQWMAGQDSVTLAEVGLSDGRDQFFLRRYFNQASSDWYRWMVQYDPEKYLSQIRVPVFALNGSEDIMVTPNENIGGFHTYVPDSLLKTKIYPGLNHMYQHCTRCDNTESGEIDEVFAPEALEDIATWIMYHFEHRENEGR